jgi:hypothetical protein
MSVDEMNALPARSDHHVPDHKRQLGASSRADVVRRSCVMVDSIEEDSGKGKVNQATTVGR